MFLYIIILAALTFFIFRVYTYRQRLRNELKIVKIENQHKESLYQAKIQFFTNISHEFRTPLSLILPPIQELLKGPMPDGVYEKMLTLAGRNAQRLYKLVNQLLDFRKIEASGLELNLTKVNMGSFCRDIFTSFDDMAARHEIKWEFNCEEDEIIADIDTEKIETIIFNLLSNAYKYTPYGGLIKVVVSTVSGYGIQPSVQIAVIDSGMGISKNDMPHIFEQFYQTPESKSLKVGSGIGLTLAWEYAKIHGGTILVESEPNSGSTFKLLIPIINNPSIQMKSSPITKIYGSGQKQFANIQLPSTAKRILIIDDNDDILDFIELNLKNTYHISCAKNGKEGVDLFEKIRPHLVISDIMMPVMDGFEVCSFLKNNKVTAHIPVILLTAKSLDAHKSEGIHKGADLYITKPFDIEYLKSCIQNIFRRDEQLAGYIKTELMVNPREHHESVKSTDEMFVQKVMETIETNLSNPSLSVEMISSDMGMSATHLYRKLKEITGHSTKDIILNYRMQKAAGMIVNKEGNVTEIMYAVGFSSLSSFSKSFKTKFGVPPSEYKHDKKEATDKG